MALKLTADKEPEKVNVLLPVPSARNDDVYLPFWERGSGHYGNTLGQITRGVVDLSTDLILPYVDSVPVTSKKVPFTIGDYGANDGYASMELFSQIIKKLREKHGQALTFEVIYEDQEINDFSSLFKRLHEHGSYLKEESKVFAMVVAGDFYQQCVPDETFDVILASFATHWLKDPGVTFTDSMFYFTATSETEVQQFRRAAAQEWRSFLLLRAREMKPGGVVIIITSSTKEGHNNNSDTCSATHGHSNGHVTTSGTSVTSGHDVSLDVEAAWKELRREKVISEEEFQSCTVKVAKRTGREITEPFESDSSPVRQAGLSLLYHDQIVYPCIYKAMWRERLQKDGVDDRRFFAEQLITAHRVWVEPVCRASLSDMRTEDEKSAILKRFFETVTARVASSHPEMYRSETIVSRLVAQKCH